MSSIFPIRSEPTPGGQDPRVVDLEGEDADAVFGALSSDTAREVVASLHDEPRTQSEIAEELDTTVQNVRYHLDNLEEAGLVEVVDTWYSSRGNEMKVYAPADGALIVSGDRSEASRLKTALTRLVGGVGVIGMASLLLESIADRLATSGSTAGTGGDGGLSGSGDGAAPAGGDGADGAALTGEDGADAGGADAPDTDAEYADGAGEQVHDATTESVDRAPDATEAAADAARNATRTVTDGGLDVSYNANLSATTTDAGPLADAAGSATSLSPGLAFFLGGVSVLVVVTALWYWSR